MSDSYEISAKVSADDSDFEAAINRTIQGMENFSANISTMSDAAKGSFSNLANQFQAIDDQAKLWGDTTDTITQKQQALSDEINKLISSGISPASQQIQDLKKVYDDLGKSQEDQVNKERANKEGLESWGISLEQLGEKGTEVFKQFGVDLDQFSYKTGISKESLVAMAAGVMIAVEAVKKIAEIVSECTQEFAEDETAILKFNSALSASPLLSSSDRSALESFVGTFSKLTGNTRAATEGMIAMLSATGRNRDEIEKMMQAALALSNATGGDLNTALTQINATFSGTSGRLSRMTPELKDLTKTQLENGDAVDVILAKYGQLTNALEGSVKVSMDNYKNTWSEVMSMMGQIAEQKIRPVREALNSLGEAILDNDSGLSKFAAHFNNIVEIFKQMGLSLVGQGDIFKAINKELEAMKGNYDNTTKAVDSYTISLMTSDKVEAGRIASYLEGQKREVTARLAEGKAAEEAAAAKKKAADDAANAEKTALEELAKAEEEYNKKALSDLQKKQEAEIKASQDKTNKIISLDNEWQKNYELTLTKTSADKIKALQKEEADEIDKAKKLEANDKTIANIHATYQNKIVQETQDATKKQVAAGLTLHDAFSNYFDNLKVKAQSWNDTVSTIADTIGTTLSGALADLGKALVGSHDAWKSMANMALTALSDILSAIGKQLAAMAISTYPNFAEMALAAAGAAAAFVASGVISGLANKYAATGDDYTSAGYYRVGELGPETVYLSQGNKVANASETASGTGRAASGSSGTTIGSIVINSPTANANTTARIMKRTMQQYAFLGNT